MAHAKQTSTTVTDAGKAKGETRIVIPELNLPRVIFLCIGESSLVQQRFSEKSRQQMISDQEAGSTTRKGRKLPPKDFKACFEAAQHRTEAGGWGHPASAFRNAAISACRICNFHMTKGKLSIFSKATSLDSVDATPLVDIIAAPPEMNISPVRLPNGSLDMRARPMWKKWCMAVEMEYDADQFTEKDMYNLMVRVGKQVGIGEGRHDSKGSCGVGWGCFRLAESEADWKQACKEALQNPKSLQKKVTKKASKTRSKKCARR